VIKNLSTVLLPLLAAGALAQDTEPQEEQVEVRRYTVEMMIFAYEQSLTGGSEVFMPDEPELTEIELVAYQSRSELPVDDDRYAFVMLPAEEFVLLDVVADLDELDAYIPLMHFGWTQPMLPDDATELRSLSSFATPPEGLEGDLSLYLGRYLHLAVNLQLDATTVEKMLDIEVPDDSAETDATQEMPERYVFGDGINEIGFEGTLENDVVTYPVRYRIEEDRIVRNGELRYFDHPMFGVLAKITRVEKQEPNELDDEFEGELLGYDGE